jgi:glycosyltransferase involved in cell wall biosynthesis
LKGLFIHDHVFYNYKNQYFSPGGLPSFVWNRYLEHVDSLTVMSRGMRNDQTPLGMISADKEGVFFKLFYNVKGGFDYYKYYSEIKLKLEKEIKISDFIIIRMPSTIGSFAADICKKTGKKYVVEVVGCAWDSNWNYGSFLVKIQAGYRYFKMKEIVSKGMAAIYVTKYFLQARYPNKKINSHASNVQIQDSKDEILTNHLSFLRRSKDYYSFGIIGNLEIKYKGFDVACSALSKLNNEGVKFIFYIVGGGNQLYLRKLIKQYNIEECVEIIGRLESGDKVFNFLDNLDLYIHPSKQEGLPRAVIEAMSRACPVLASSVAGIPELISAEFLHKPGDKDKLYSDIKKVLTQENLFEVMAIDNFNKSKAYNIDVLSKRRNKFFLKVKQIYKFDSL